MENRWMDGCMDGWMVGWMDAMYTSSLLSPISKYIMQIHSNHIISYEYCISVRMDDFPFLFCLPSGIHIYVQECKFRQS